MPCDSHSVLDRKVGVARRLLWNWGNMHMTHYEKKWRPCYAEGWSEPLKWLWVFACPFGWGPRFQSLPQLLDTSTSSKTQLIPTDTSTQQTFPLALSQAARLKTCSMLVRAYHKLLAVQTRDVSNTEKRQGKIIRAVVMDDNLTNKTVDCKGR